MKFQKNTTYLIDANVIVRLLVDDKSSSAFQKAYQFFESIGKKEIKGVIQVKRSRFKVQCSKFNVSDVCNFNMIQIIIMSL